VRIIAAATYQDLEIRVRKGKFREDLFHHLNVIRVYLPPLRERCEG
jgi:two-component system nitrogen regulation response regulator GlnG